MAQLDEDYYPTFGSFGSDLLKMMATFGLMNKNSGHGMAMVSFELSTFGFRMLFDVFISSDLLYWNFVLYNLLSVADLD